MGPIEQKNKTLLLTDVVSPEQLKGAGRWLLVGLINLWATGEPALAALALQIEEESITGLQRLSFKPGRHIAALALKQAVGQSVQVKSGGGVPWCLQSTSVRWGTARLERGAETMEVMASSVRGLSSCTE